MTYEERAYNYASKKSPSKFTVGEIAKHYNDGYIDGYEDATNKARQWLLEQMFELNACEEIYVADGDASTLEEFLDNFIKAMEKQQ